MKRLLTCLFLVLGLGLIFSGSTFAKKKDWAVFKIIDKKQEGIEAVIALCSNEKNLNKVTLSYFYNLSEYKKMEVLKMVNVIMLLTDM